MPGSFCFLFRVRGGGATGVGGGIAPGGVEGAISNLGMLEDGEAFSVSLSELLPPACPGPFVASFEFVGAMLQVLGVASLLATPEVGVVSNLGMLEGGKVSSVSLSELPPPLWSWRGSVRLSSHRYG